MWLESQGQQNADGENSSERNAEVMGRKKIDKLAQDASKAIAANMSYGKWKAMQQPVAATTKSIPEGWKVCPQCGKQFRSSQGKKFCDDVCRRQAYREKELELNRQYYHRKKELK